MNKQRGGVSIFLVVFTALLVTIVTTSFVQLMLRNQQQASNNDLSQSAFDSALAGIEDAKRALVRFKECRLTPLAGNCPTILSQLSAEDQPCDLLDVDNANVVDFINGEVMVGEPNANQAYTCVKIDVTTESYEGILETADDQVLIPLDSIGPASAINKIRVSWFNNCDMSTPNPANPSAPCVAVGGPTLPGAPDGLPQPSAWPASQPPILRNQLIQYSGSLNLNSFNDPGTDTAKTLFIYPTSTSVNDQFDFSDDVRRAVVGSNTPQEVRCSTDFALGLDGYLCTATIVLPPMSDRHAYLHLSSIYNKAHFKVELLDSSDNIIEFDAVQPRVDSTGRASSLFRRLEAKIFLAPGGGPTLTMPSAALSLKNSLCKDIFVTNAAGDFRQDNDGLACDPDS